MLFLSGIFFPLAALPGFLGTIVKIIPLTYLADAMRQVMINSTPDFPLTTDLAVVAAWAVVCALLSARLFKWE
jgi:ABC-2 type transport system permease protein